MNVRSAIIKIPTFLPLLLLLFYPVFCRYNPALSNNGFFDFLSMNQNVIWFLVVFTVCVGTLAWVKKDISTISMIAIVLLFSIVQVASNYPMIFARDVYLQGSVTKVLADTGHIGTTWNTYGENNPGFFLIWSSMTTITGLDVVSCNLFILLPVAIFLFMSLLLLFFRRLSIPIPNTLATFSFLLICFNQTAENTFFHFNTRLLAAILTLLFICIFLPYKHLSSREFGRSRVILLFVVFIAIVACHILIPLVPIAFVLFFWLINRKNLTNSYSMTSYFAISLLIVFCLWTFVYSRPSLDQALTALLDVGSRGGVASALSTSSGWFALSWNLPLFGTLLNSWFKAFLIILGLFSIYAVIKYRVHAKTKVLGVLFVSTIIPFGIAFFSGIGGISVDRALIFASIAMVPLFAMAIFYGKKSFCRKSKSIRIRLFVVLVTVLIIPMFALENILPIASFANVQPLNSASVFISNNRSNQTLVSLAEFPMYYCFFEPNYTKFQNSYLGNSRSSTLSNITDFYIHSPQASLKIIDARDIVDWGVLAGHSNSYSEAYSAWTIVENTLNQRFNRIYDNSYQIVYR